MNMTRDRLQSIGWFTLLAFCTVVTGSLMLRVNAVKSQVELSQRRIIALKRENEFLATEYETRANQQQLSAINDLDFGYKAPDAGQYLGSERQLAMLGKPRGADAPAPIEVAVADDTGPADDNAGHDGLGTLVPQLASRLASRAMAEVPAAGRAMADLPAPARAMAADVPAPARRGRLDAANLRERLARIDPPEHSE